MFQYCVTLSYDNTIYNEQESLFCDTLEQCYPIAETFLMKAVLKMGVSDTIHNEEGLTFYRDSLKRYCDNFHGQAVKSFKFKSALITITMPHKNRPGYIFRISDGFNVVLDRCSTGNHGKLKSARDFKQYCENMANTIGLTEADRIDCLSYIENAIKAFKQDEKPAVVSFGKIKIVLKKAE